MSATTTSPSQRSILATLANADAAASTNTAVIRLMIAAADAFSDKGFHATTTRDIASRAGLSPAGVYVHFSSKEELLYELSRRGHQAARDQLVAAAESAATPTEALRELIGGFSRWHAEHFQIARIVQYEFRHLSPAHRDSILAQRKEIDEVVKGMLRAGVEAGEFAIDDLSGTALAVLSIAIDVARWYSPEIRRTPDEIAATNADLAIRLVTNRG